MGDIISGIALSLAKDESYASSDIAIPAKTDQIELNIARPTTGGNVTWGEHDRLRVRIILSVDGAKEICEQIRYGGIRLDHNKDERTHYTLKWKPSYGFITPESLTPKRLGETAKTSFTAKLEITSLDNKVTTTLTTLNTEKLSLRPA